MADRSDILFLLGFFGVVALSLFIFNNVFADTSTQAKYCTNGVCNTNTTSPYFNESIGIYKVGQYPGGIKLYQTHKIGIQESKTCLTLLKNNMNSSCIPYDKLIHFDNTNPIWAGLWNQTGWFHRGPPLVKNHELANSHPYVVMVDPNPDFTTTARMIIVTDKNFSYINPDDKSNKGTTTIYHVDRFVANCELATVAPDISLINDTIHYLESDCTKTRYNDTRISSQPEISWQWNNPYSSLLQDSYLQSVLHGHKSFIKPNGTITGGGLGPQLCINGHKCNYTDPYKKAGY